MLAHELEILDSDSPIRQDGNSNISSFLGFADLPSPCAQNAHVRGGRAGCGDIRHDRSGSGFSKAGRSIHVCPSPALRGFGQRPDHADFSLRAVSFRTLRFLTRTIRSSQTCLTSRNPETYMTLPAVEQDRIHNLLKILVYLHASRRDNLNELLPEVLSCSMKPVYLSPGFRGCASRTLHAPAFGPVRRNLCSPRT